jgi:hypothetical protein
MSDYLVIDDSNYREFSPSFPDGRPHPGYLGWTRPGVPHSFAAGKPITETIPRSEWPDRIKAGKGNWLSDMLKANNVRSKDQDGLSLCWCYGSTRAVETRRLSLGMIHKELSPESVAGPCTGWNNQGGYASEAFNQFEKGGACEVEYMDSPHSLRPSRWKSGWQQNAAKYEATQWYEIGTSFDEVMTSLLLRLPVAAGLDWWGHLVCFLDPYMFDDGSFGVIFQNSWGFDWPTAGANGFSVLSERKATPDGAAVPFIVIGDAVNPPDPTILPIIFK